MFGFTFSTTLKLSIFSALVSGATAGYGGWWLANNIADKKIAEMKQEAAEAKQLAQEMIVLRERANHASVNQATQQAVNRERKAHADATAARNELRMLNEAVGTFLGNSEAAAASAELRADMLGNLLGSCAARYIDMAEKADRADNTARTLIQAWPK